MEFACACQSRYEGSMKHSHRKPFHNKDSRSFGTDKPFSGKGKPFGKAKSAPHRDHKPDHRDKKAVGRVDREQKPDHRPDHRDEKPANRFSRDRKPDRRPKHHAERRPERRPEHRDQRPQRPEQKQVQSAPLPVGDSAHLIWGLHAVRSAWLNPKRRCHRLWLTEAGEKAMNEARAEAQQLLLKRPDAKRVERYELERLLPPGSVHQGIVLEAAPLHEPSLHDIITGENPPDLLVMLDQVTDPHNVGAILRSAAALGAGAVIMTERNAPGATGVLAKSASGALEYVPQIHVVNLARVLDELQEAGYWRVGLAEEGTKQLSALDLSGRTVLVLGAEGEGLRQLTRKKCDELARLPTTGAIGSLNVSNAAAVALYEARRQKTPFA
jgi:23S rRNA (guanosine2251-2'-O)-methyltransferase